MEFSLACQQDLRQLAGMSEPNPQSIKKGACTFLRQSAVCFVDHAAAVDPAPAKRRTTDRLRHELSCLITLYEEGIIDPVSLLETAPLNPSTPSDEAAPLTGTTP